MEHETGEHHSFSEQLAHQGEEKVGEPTLNTPLFLFTSQGYILDWDEDGNPFMRFDTGKIGS